MDFGLSPLQRTSPLEPTRGRAEGRSEGREGGRTEALDRKARGIKDTVELSPEAQKQVDKLKARDQQVRAHEAAHLSAGGGVARGGAPSSYQRGPDGQNYAGGGEVAIDASPVANNPSATLAKAQQIQAAALAPADPSPQDRKVAAQASRMAAEASRQMAEKAQQAGSVETPKTTQALPGMASDHGPQPPVPARTPPAQPRITPGSAGARLDLMA